MLFFSVGNDLSLTTLNAKSENGARDFLWLPIKSGNTLYTCTHKLYNAIQIHEAYILHTTKTQKVKWCCNKKPFSFLMSSRCSLQATHRKTNIKKKVKLFEVIQAQPTHLPRAMSNRISRISPTQRWSIYIKEVDSLAQYLWWCNMLVGSHRQIFYSRLGPNC